MDEPMFERMRRIVGDGHPSAVNKGKLKRKLGTASSVSHRRYQAHVKRPRRGKVSERLRRLLEGDS